MDDERGEKTTGQMPDPGGRAKPDAVEEANAGSFPASDPPAWTAARAGRPEGRDEKRSRTDDALPPARCEAIAMFAGEAQAQSAAEELLAAGVASVEIGPPREHGRLAAGLGARPHGQADALPVFCALLGAAAAGLGAILTGRAATLFTLGTGAVLGAAAGCGAAPRLRDRRSRLDDWPREGACLLRVAVNSAEDERRVLLTAENHGARALRLHWHRVG